MKLSEVFERAGIATDDKARRVLNTSNAVAGISAEEIEAGVTLERLESIGVPVYRYTTQITVHGRLPDFSEAARPAGYKAVFQNGNGTIGVRYVAIDATKKARMIEACSYGAKGWHTHLTSEGLTVAQHFTTKDECLAAYRAFPKDLICGGVTAGAGVYGGFWVLAYVGAIPEANLWPLISQLWGITTAEQLAELKLAREVANASDAAERKRKHDENMALIDEKRRALAASVTLPRLSSLPTGPCQFVRVARTFTGGALKLYTLAKRGPALCYAVQDWPSAGAPGKFSRLDAAQLQRFRAECSQGVVFAAQ